MRLVYLVCFCIIATATYAQKPINLSVSVDSSITEYYTCINNHDTAYIIGYRGYSKTPTSRIFTEYVLTKFYKDKIINHSFKVIDSQFDQYQDGNVLKYKDKLVFYTTSNFNYRQYFMHLDQTGKYITHYTDSANSEYGIIPDFIQPLKNGGFISIAIKSFTNINRLESIYFISDSTYTKSYISPFSTNNINHNFQRIFLSSKGTPIILGSIFNYRCDTSFNSKIRLLHIGEDNLPTKDVLNYTEKIIPKDALAMDNGDYIVVGGRFDTADCQAFSILSTPIISRLDSNLKIKWSISSKPILKPDGFYQRVQKTADGNYIAIGVMYEDKFLDSNRQSRMTGLITKFDEAGVVLWKKEYKLNDSSDYNTKLQLNDFTELSNGDIVAIGYIRAEGIDRPINTFKQKGWILKLNKDGNLLYSSIKLSQINGIEVFPNPTTDRVTVFINLDKTSTVIYSLYDMMGKLVMNTGDNKSKSGEVKEEIDLSKLTKGMYILHIRINDKETSVKIIKE